MDSVWSINAGFNGISISSDILFVASSVPFLAITACTPVNIPKSTFKDKEAKNNSERIKATKPAPQNYSMQ